MSLKGNLQSVDLANVLQMLSINQKEGTLVLFDGDTRKSIYFSREGVSMLSRGRRGQDTLGRVLLRYGRISPDQLQEALRVQEQEGRRLGSVLQHMGVVTNEDIENAIRTQIEEEIYNLFIWREASFEFIEGPPPPAMENLPTRVTFNVNSLIMEAQRRADEWNYIRGLVPSLEEIYRATNTFADANVEDPVFHLPFAMSVLESVNQGNMDVSELIEHSYGGKFEVCKILAILLEQGAIEPVNLSDLARMAEEATGRAEHRQAAKFYRRIVELGGATPQVNLSLGYALEALEEPEQASHFLKAGAETYADGNQPKYAFDAYLRVARSLPTDLAAIQRLVEIGCENDDVLAANRHEIVETGRMLSDCLREIGKGTQALKVLHRLAQKNPEDMALRSQLAGSFQAEGMSQEAMAELEAMATVCASRKSYEEAIRYLKKVQNIDRNRAGVLKRIETLGRARDRNKRLLIRTAFLVTGVATIGAVAWGLYDWHQTTQAQVKLMNDDIQQKLGKGSEDIQNAFEKLHTLLLEAPAFPKLEGEDLRVIVSGASGEFKSMKELARTNALAATDLKNVYGDRLPADFVQNRREKDDLNIKNAAKRLEQFAGGILQEADGRHRAAVKFLKEDGRPSEAIPGLERAILLLDSTIDGLGAPGVDQVLGVKTIADLKALQEQVRKDLETVHGYATRRTEAQARADELWQQGQLREARDMLAGFLAGHYSPEMDEGVHFRFRVRVTPSSARIELMKGGAGIPPVVVSPGVHDLAYTISEGIEARVVADGYEEGHITIAAVPSRSYDLEGLIVRTPYEGSLDLRKVPVWSVTLGPGGSESSIVAIPGGARVAATDRGGAIHVIDLKDGNKRTFDSESTSGFRCSPVASATSVFAPSMDGSVFCIDPKTMELRWKVGTAGDDRSPGPVQSRPILMGGTLVIAGIRGVVVGLDAATGQLRWRKSLPLPRDMGCRVPLVEAAGCAVAACDDGRIYCIDPANGEFIILVPGKPGDDQSLPAPRGAPLVLGRYLLVPQEGSQNGFVLMDMPDAGTSSPKYGRRWELAHPSASPLFSAPDGPSGGTGVFLVFTDGSFLRFPILKPPSDASGAVRLLPGEEIPLKAPALDTGILYIATTRALRALRIDGSAISTLWTWSMEGGVTVTSPPSIAGGHVLVTTTDGKLHAILKDE